MCRNIVFGLVDLPYDRFFAPSLSRNNRPHAFKLQKGHTEVDVVKKFFSNRVIDLWNSLPSSVVLRGTVQSFRMTLKSFLGSNEA